MNDFDFIEGKVPNSKPYVKHPFWNELPSIPKIQSFYEKFSEAEGWIDEVFFIIWPEQDVASVWQEDKMGTPKDFLFFGSNGGGDGFGCHWFRGCETYFSAPFISDLDSDRTDLGDWDAFRTAILEENYI